MPVLAPHRRPLTDQEQRTLRGRSSSLRSRGRKATAASWRIGAATVAVLWILTLLASDSPWVVITAFWLVIGTALAVWIRRDMVADRHRLDAMADRLRSALARNEADVYDIRATRFIEFEEVEDEGACYAFELEDGRVVFVDGQEFYDSARFPSLDFSLVHPLDEAGHTVDMLIEKRGPKAKPIRTVPAAIKKTMELPGHLEVRQGGLDSLPVIGA